MGILLTMEHVYLPGRRQVDRLELRADYTELLFDRIRKNARRFVGGFIKIPSMSHYIARRRKIAMQLSTHGRPDGAGALVN
jgi:hypothetical protein